jgi:hypothetical protein
MFLTQLVQVSEKMVPFHRRHIQPLDGSNYYDVEKKKEIQE